MPAEGLFGIERNYRAKEKQRAKFLPGKNNVEGHCGKFGSVKLYHILLFFTRSITDILALVNLF